MYFIVLNCDSSRGPSLLSAAGQGAATEPPLHRARVAGRACPRPGRSSPRVLMRQPGPSTIAPARRCSNMTSHVLMVCCHDETTVTSSGYRAPRPARPGSARPGCCASGVRPADPWKRGWWMSGTTGVSVSTTAPSLDGELPRTRHLQHPRPRQSVTLPARSFLPPNDPGLFRGPGPQPADLRRRPACPSVMGSRTAALTQHHAFWRIATTDASPRH